jgi:very-short-patch-repair endonuclease
MIKNKKPKETFQSHERSKYWSNKNELKPNEVALQSSKKIIFNCNCGHEFESFIYNITNGQWCQYCSNPPKLLCNKDECKQCFEKSIASHEKAKFWSDKNKISSRQIFKGSIKKYLFECECGHNFESSPNNITKGNWCPYCANKKLCDKEDCKQCFEKSIASHEKAKFWSKENELTATQVFKGSIKKYLFECKCGHNFESSPNDINFGSWCPYCAEPSKLLCNKDDCKQCFEKSFATHEKAKFWSKENELMPRQVFKGSVKKYLFDCQCGHNFESRLHDINSGNWCSYCVNQKLCDKDDCKQCFEKSFASYKNIDQWSHKNEVISRQVFKSSGKKYWFICEQKHEYEQSLNSKSNGSGCPYCVNKTEQKLFNQLIKDYSTLQQQYRVNWCKKKTYLPFDFVIPEHNIIIELDGPQHFIQISNWSSPEEQYINDMYKMDCANKNKYSIIRLTQEGVFYDTYDWYNELKENIEKIIKYKNIQNIYMCMNNEYDIFNLKV